MDGVIGSPKYHITSILEAVWGVLAEGESQHISNRYMLAGAPLVVSS
jgi:hypothetical protein